jgi:hypothetical protein
MAGSGARRFQPLLQRRRLEATATWLEIRDGPEACLSRILRSLSVVVLPTFP